MPKFLTTERQKSLESYTRKLVGSYPETLPKDKAFEYLYYNLVYTGESNCECPNEWINVASEAWEKLRKEEQSLPEAPKFNSVYGQLFSENSWMAAHKDEYVDWGVSVSLGASCEFRFGNNYLTLNSGDVFIADFSKVVHSVEKIWPNSETSTRMSVQIRQVSKCPRPITMAQFEQMIR